MENHENPNLFMGKSAIDVMFNSFLYGLPGLHRKSIQQCQAMSSFFSGGIHLVSLVRSITKQMGHGSSMAKCQITRE